MDEYQDGLGASRHAAPRLSQEQVLQRGPRQLEGDPHAATDLLDG